MNITLIAPASPVVERVEETNEDQNSLRELTSLELALVGGGSGNVMLV